MRSEVSMRTRRAGLHQWRFVLPATGRTMRRCSHTSEQRPIHLASGTKLTSAMTNQGNGENPNGAALFEAADRCAAASSPPSTSTSSSAWSSSSTSPTRSSRAASSSRRALATRTATSTPTTKTSAPRSSRTATSTSPRTSSGSREEARWDALLALRLTARHRRAASTARWTRSSRRTTRCAASCRRIYAARADRPPRRSASSCRPIAKVGFGDDAEHGARRARPRLRVLHQGVRPLRGPPRRRVLHARQRRPAAGRDAGALPGPRLRPGLRLVRHVHPVGEVHRGPRRHGPTSSRSTARR